MSASEAALSRQRILEEATRLFVRFGYHGVSMREIAEATGLSKPALYYHFKDKEDLILAILNENLTQVGDIVQACRQNEVSARGRIRAMTQAFFEQPVEQRAVIYLATREIAHLSEAARAQFGEVYRQVFVGQIAAILEEGIQSGELRPMDTHLGTWVLLGMLYPFFFPGQERQGERRPLAVESILSIFFDGAGQHD